MANCFVEGQKIINWVEMPAMIGNDEYIEFFKRNIYIKKVSGKIEKFRIPNATNETASFYNLDKIFLLNNVSSGQFYEFSKVLIKKILETTGHRSLVHTNLINPNIARLFRSEGIPYIEKNLEDRTVAFNTTLNLIEPLFSFNNEVLRSAVRIDLLAMKYRVEISVFNNYSIQSTGVIKDVSLNGVGIILNKQHELNFFPLREKVALKFYLGSFYIKINLAIVTRIDEKNNMVGLNFNLTDKNMVNDLDADKFSHVIYKFVHEKLVDLEKENSEA